MGYHLFTYDYYQPGGGMGHYVGVYDTIEAAQQAHAELAGAPYDSGEIVQIGDDGRLVVAREWNEGKWRLEGVRR